MADKRAFYGSFIYAPELGKLKTFTGYLLTENGIIQKQVQKLPENYEGDCYDLSKGLVIPPFCDMHLHAGQYENIGIGYDYRLLEWLERYTYPTEKRFYNLNYSARIYKKLLKDLWKNGSLYFVSMCTASADSTALFIDMIAQSGLNAFVGKRNTDFQITTTDNEDTRTSYEGTKRLLFEKGVQYPNVHYILSPSFVPGCTEEMMQLLGKLAEETGAAVQSHLDETQDEVILVKNRFPEFSYADVYERYKLLRDGKTIMAHCNYVTDEEIALLKRRKVMVAHCPCSNLDLGSGVMPLRKLQQNGIPIGFGSDISGGHTLNMMVVLVTAIEVSKIRHLQFPEEEPINMAEAFFFATKGGGEFFGKTGSFEEGYPFDALVICDEPGKDLSVEERLEKIIYEANPDRIVKRYLHAKEVEEPAWEGVNGNE